MGILPASHAILTAHSQTAAVRSRFTHSATRRPLHSADLLEGAALSRRRCTLVESCRLWSWSTTAADPGRVFARGPLADRPGGSARGCGPHAALVATPTARRPACAGPHTSN